MFYITNYAYNAIGSPLVVLPLALTAFYVTAPSQEDSETEDEHLRNVGIHMCTKIVQTIALGALSYLAAQRVSLSDVSRDISRNLFDRIIKKAFILPLLEESLRALITRIYTQFIQQFQIEKTKIYTQFIEQFQIEKNLLNLNSHIGAFLVGAFLANLDFQLSSWVNSQISASSYHKLDFLKKIMMSTLVSSPIIAHSLSNLICELEEFNLISKNIKNLTLCGIPLLFFIQKTAFDRLLTKTEQNERVIIPSLV